MTTDFETRLSSALREQDHSDTWPHLTLNDVTPTARRIRRRRIAGGGVAALAAVALAAPVAFQHLGAAPGPQNPPPTSTASDLPSTVTLSVDDPAPDPAQDDVPQLQLTEFVSGAEPTPSSPMLGTAQLTVSATPAGQLPDMHDVGRFLVQQGDGLLHVWPRTDSDIAPYELPGNGVVRLADDRTLAAVVTTDRQVVVIGPDGNRRTLATLDAPAVAIDVIGTSVGAGSCLDPASTGRCEVLVSAGSTGEPVVVRGDGGQSVVVPGAREAQAASADHVAVTGADGCLDVVRRTHDAEAWDTAEAWGSCELAVDSFSPDGKLALVTDATGTPATSASRIGLADALTGDVLTWISLTEGTFKHWVFAPGSQFLSVLWLDDQGREAISRIHLDGRVELASEPVTTKRQENLMPILNP